MSEEFICYVPRNICLADLDHHFGKIRLGVSRRLRIRWGVLVDTVALEGAVPKPTGNNEIALSDQIYCGGRIYEGRGGGGSSLSKRVRPGSSATWWEEPCCW
jgi:hypothetical protein